MQQEIPPISGQLLGWRPRSAATLLGALFALFIVFTVFAAWLMNYYTLQAALVGVLSITLIFLCLVRVEWVLYLLVFACLFSPQMAVGDILGRAAKRAITVRVEDVLLIVLGMIWLVRVAAEKELGLLVRTPLNRPIVLYAVVCIVATGIGVLNGWVAPAERLASVFFVAKYLQYFILFFVMMHHVHSPRILRNIVIAGVVTYVAVCLYGFIQLPWLPAGARPSTYGEKYGEPNTLAGYLLFMLGICSGLLLLTRNALGKMGWGVLCVLGVVLLGFTLSRSGWAGLFGILVVLLFLGRHKLVVVGTLAAIGAVLLLVSFRLTWLPNTIETRMRETGGQFEELTWAPPVRVLGWKLDPSASERVRSYQDAMKTWSRRVTEAWVPLLTGSGVLGGRPFVDGQYVRVLSETGLLGLLTFGLLMAAIWRGVWRTYKTVRTPWYRGLALGYLAGFAGLLIHALGANTFIIVRIMEPFFIFTGVVMLLPSMEQHPEHELVKAFEGRELRYNGGKASR